MNHIASGNIAIEAMAPVEIVDVAQLNSMVDLSSSLCKGLPEGSHG